MALAQRPLAFRRFVFLLNASDRRWHDLLELLTIDPERPHPSGDGRWHRALFVLLLYHLGNAKLRHIVVVGRAGAAPRSFEVFFIHLRLNLTVKLKYGVLLDGAACVYHQARQPLR